MKCCSEAGMEPVLLACGVGPWGARVVGARGDGEGAQQAGGSSGPTERASCVFGETQPGSLGPPPQPTGSQSVLTHTNLLPCTQGGRPLLADSLSPPPSVWSGKRPLPVCALPHCLHRCPVGPQQPGRGKASVLGKNPARSWSSWNQHCRQRGRFLELAGHSRERGSEDELRVT